MFPKKSENSARLCMCERVDDRIEADKIKKNKVEKKNAKSGQHQNHHNSQHS